MCCNWQSQVEEDGGGGRRDVAVRKGWSWRHCSCFWSCSVAKSCPTYCSPMDCSTPGLSVLHSLSWSLLKFMSIESVMLSNHLILFYSLLLLSSIFPSIRVFSNELVLCIGSLGASASASVLPINIQGWFPLGLTGLIPLQSKGLSRVFSSTIIWKHQFFGAQLSIWSNSHICTWKFLILDRLFLIFWTSVTSW